MMTSGRPRLACGVDVVDVAAVGRALNATDGRMGWVCFTDRERDEAEGRLDRVASRWAVKEAVAKALGAGLMQGVGFRDVEVLASVDGQLELTLHGEAKRLAAERGLMDWAISVSHEGGIAVAFVVAMRASDNAGSPSEEESDG
jgi:holo-[acyl-carrier protein] synthase